MGDLPEPGETIDGFRIGERIHAGGMGVLHRVTRDDLTFPAVMKIPRLGPGEPASSIISFEVEQSVLPALRGPHVPRFVAAGDLTVRPYLVMEEIAGRSLAEWAARAPLPPAEVAALGKAVADALDALHRQEAIHLDVKPSNVLLREDGTAVLIDLGLAHHGHHPDLLAEDYGRPIGSAPYLSPEQVVGVRSEPRSDLFSLGVVLYQLATGKLPFGSPGPGGLRARLWKVPIPPRALEPAVPGWLQEVILHCLEPDAARRPASAAQVAFDLAHPEQVQVGERGRRLRRPGRLEQLGRWLRAAGYAPAAAALPSSHVSAAPILVVAVATEHADEARLEALRQAVRQLLAAPGTRRLACVTVVRPAPELGGSRPEDTAAHRRLRRLALLRSWAEPLGLEASGPGAPRASFHVLEGASPAEALLAFARHNRVDHIVLGAPAREASLRGLLGTVATQVAMEAPCTVTLVRARAT